MPIWNIEYEGQFQTNIKQGDINEIIEDVKDNELDIYYTLILHIINTHMEATISC